MPLNPYVVRAATDDDFNAVTKIYAHHVLHGLATFELVPPDRATMLQRRAAILALGLPFLVAETHKKIVGYAYASAYRPRPAYRFTIEDSIYVDTEYAGHGCGRALLSALIDLCAKGPWQQMIAVIGDTANVRSIRLHEHFGFQHVGTLQAVGFKFEKWVDSVLMQKALKIE
jgi:L-amino acid N-acyltransferase YncA